MSSTAIAWIRRDLRVHDNPVLSAAAAGGRLVVPVFVLDRRLLGGRFPSPGRGAFLLGCLRELRDALQDCGSTLVVREGRPEQVLVALAQETEAGALHFAADVSPFAQTRDAAVRSALEPAGVTMHAEEGNFVVDVGAVKTGAGGDYRVFSPFHRAWEKVERREVLSPLGRARGELEIDPGRLPSPEEIGAFDPPQPIAEPGETAAREAMGRWLTGGVADYNRVRNDLAGGASELSMYLHFGCLSARELESHVAALPGSGPASYRRQLCWRDFYGQVLLHNPSAARLELQERMRALRWEPDDELLAAWTEGRTGYPVVDAAMRQLRESGYMHNRARLIAGSFLTKDLHQDWRAGERHFMRHLLDGDEASNNGNWQWIASVGADPAPYFRRLLNPITQQLRHDPTGEYVRRWVPELSRVPLEHLAEPWLMSGAEQSAAGCVIGRDYPAPIVEHAAERRRAIERYQEVLG